MLIIRFVRTGRKNSSFFKLVVAEKARAVQKKPFADLGWFNPHTGGGKGEFKFDAEAIKKYIDNGAQITQSVARKLVKEGIKEAGKFIIERTAKPKKEEIKSKEPQVEAEKEKKSEETPAEEPAKTEAVADGKSE